MKFCVVIVMKFYEGVESDPMTKTITFWCGDAV